MPISPVCNFPTTNPARAHARYQRRYPRAALKAMQVKEAKQRDHRDEHVDKEAKANDNMSIPITTSEAIHRASTKTKRAEMGRATTKRGQAGEHQEHEDAEHDRDNWQGGHRNHNTTANRGQAKGNHKSERHEQDEELEGPANSTAKTHSSGPRKQHHQRKHSPRARTLGQRHTTQDETLRRANHRAPRWSAGPRQDPAHPNRTNSARHPYQPQQEAATVRPRARHTGKPEQEAEDTKAKRQNKPRWAHRPLTRKTIKPRRVKRGAEK